MPQVGAVIKALPYAAISGERLVTVAREDDCPGAISMGEAAEALL